MNSSRLLAALALVLVATAQVQTKPVMQGTVTMPKSLKVNPARIVQGECYTITVENGANMTLDTEYVFTPAGSRYETTNRLWGWPSLNSSGELEVCSTASTPPGTYHFKWIRNTLQPISPLGFQVQPVDATVSVDAAASLATSISLSPERTSQGSCYVLSGFNNETPAYRVTLDLQYQFNDGPVQLLAGWPQLDNRGQYTVCSDDLTAIGTYRFVGVRSAGSSNWSAIDVPIVVTPRSKFAAAPIDTLIRGLAESYGWPPTSSVPATAVGSGSYTFYRFDGNSDPTLSFSFVLLQKGRDKVQLITVEPVIGFGSTVRLRGSDGITEWDARPGLFFSTGSRNPFLASQTYRSLKTLLNYQSEGIVLNDLGVNGNERVMETLDKQGRQTKYFIDLERMRLNAVEFSTSMGRLMISGIPWPNIDRFVYSDYRLVNGILTPFKIEYYYQDRIQFEYNFNNVAYGGFLSEDLFQPDAWIPSEFVPN